MSDVPIGNLSRLPGLRYPQFVSLKYRDYSRVQDYSREQLVKDLNEAHGKIRYLLLIIKIEGWALGACWALVLTLLKIVLTHR